MFLVIVLGFFGLLLLAGGAVLALFVWRNLRTSSLLGCPLSRIGKLRPGCRKVRGKVVPLRKALRGPVTNKECLYYRLRIYEERKTYKDNPRLPGGIFTALFLFGYGGAAAYRVYDEAASDARAVYSSHSLVDESFDAPLMIEDDSGCVEVDLRGAALFTKEKARIVSGDNHPPPSKIAKLLREEYGIHTVDERGHFKTLQIMEEALLVGATVTVVGTVETLEDGSLCFQQQDGPLVVSERDVSKEGRSARNRAIGFTIGAGAALGVGLGCFLGAFALIVKAWLAHK